MSLATDILWHAFVTQQKRKSKPKPAPVVAKPKPAVTAISNRNLHLAHVPGCQRLAWGWQVTCIDGKHKRKLGTFKQCHAHESHGDCGTCGSEEDMTTYQPGQTGLEH